LLTSDFSTKAIIDTYINPAVYGREITNINLNP